MRRLIAVFSVAILLLFSTLVQSAEQVESAIDSPLLTGTVDSLEQPMYTPFIERYMLDELKALRHDLQNQRLELTEKIINRELSLSDHALEYSSNTVTYFFYLIAAVSSILVIVGWTSIREIRDKVHSVANKEIQKLVETYENRLRVIESQLTQKTQHIDENRILIEKTEGVHALWLRAAQEHSDQSKIAIYDEILKLRPYNCEALTYKADSVLEIGEPQWAKNLCLQALEIDPEYGHAHYQLACAHVALNHFEDAIAGLLKAIQLKETIIEDVRNDIALAPLREHPDYPRLFESISPINK